MFDRSSAEAFRVCTVCGNLLTLASPCTRCKHPDDPLSLTPGGAETPPAPETLHCLRCNYDLRLIDHADKCPECGLAILTSIVHRNFHGASRGWLALIAAAPLALFAAMICNVLASFCATPYSLAEPTFEIAALFFLLVTGALLGIPQKRPLPTAKQERLRRLVNAASIALLCGTVPALLLTITPHGPLQAALVPPLGILLTFHVIAVALRMDCIRSQLRHESPSNTGFSVFILATTGLATTLLLGWITGFVNTFGFADGHYPMTLLFGLACSIAGLICLVWLCILACQLLHALAQTALRRRDIGV